MDLARPQACNNVGDMELTSAVLMRLTSLNIQSGGSAYMKGWFGEGPKTLWITTTMTLKTLPVTHSAPAQSTYRNNSETVYENVVFTFGKVVEYKSLTNFTR